MNIKEFLNLPNNERRMIVFNQDAREIKTILLSEPKNHALLRSIALVSMSGLALLIAEVIIRRYQTGVIHSIPLRLSNELELGGASDAMLGMIYIGHPISSQTKHYYPLDRFHEQMHEQKFMELVHILQAMKVRHFRIEYNRGYRSNFCVETRASGKGLPADGELGFERNRSGNVDYFWCEKGSGSELKQELPDNLIWYHYEDEWKHAISQIMERQVNSIEFKYHYRNDFDVKFGANAWTKDIKLKAMLKKSDFKETEWNVIVEV